MYWTDTGTNRIEKATMDGNFRAVLHISGLSTVYGLTLDYQNQSLYWIDNSRNRIERSSVTGSNRTVIRTGLNNPFGLTLHTGRVYWTDLNQHIYSTTSDSTTTIPIIAVTSSLGGSPYGIHVLSEERQPLGECKLSIRIYRVLL